jgi:zinc protease
LKGKMISWGAAPDKHLTELTLEGLGNFLEGSNGEVAWGMSAVQGPRIKEGDEKAEALLQATFNSDSEWRNVYKSAETAALESVDGKDCYKVVLTPKSGNPVTKWYDKQSNLLVKMAMTSKTAMGEIQADSLMSDYRKEGEILLPHKVVAHAAGQELVMTIDKVEHNAEIPKGKFDLPDEIKALLKKRAQ